MGLRIMSMPSLMVALVLMISVISMAEAQSGAVPDCASDLVPCAAYLNSTNPPSSCCNPIKQTVATKLTCLCNLFYSPGFLSSFNITVDQALQLSRRCGVTSDLSNCKAGSASPPSSVPPPPPATTGGAGRVAFSGLSFLLLFWASMLFN